MPSRMQSLDTNILLRFMLNDDATHFAMIVDALSRPKAQFFIPDVALIEAVHVLQTYYERDRQNISRLVTILFKPLNIHGNSELFASVIEIWQKHPALSFTDCYLAEQAKQENRAPLLTFDKRLAKQHPQTQELSSV